MWTINIMSAVVLTTITGTIVFGIWYGIGRLLEYLGFVNIVYELTKAVLPFWLLPISYIVLRLGNLSNESWGGFLFNYTPITFGVSIVFCVVWFIGCFRKLAKYIYENRIIQDVYEQCMPANVVCMDCFDEVCQELHLKAKRFRVLEFTGEGTSRISGIFRPTILLPRGTFKAEEYRVMFVHELTHYRQKVLWLRHLTAIAGAIHFMNPLIRVFDREIEEWGENACDYECIRQMDSLKTYFSILLDLAIKGQNGMGLQANLVQKNGDLESRIRKMKRSYKIMNNKKKWMAVLAVAVMTISSTVSVSAATVTAGNMYMSLYNASVVEKKAPEIMAAAADSELVLYSADGLDEGFTEEEGELSYTLYSGAAGGVDWDVAKKGSRRTPAFSASKGEKIALTVAVSPSDSIVHAGIIKPDGSRLYVEGSGFFSYQFDCETSGSYCVYVQNMSNVAIHVDGSYFVTQ